MLKIILVDRFCSLPKFRADVENLPSWNTTDFVHYLSYIIAKKNFVFISPRFKTYITQLSIDFTTLESLFSQLVFRKELFIVCFIFHVKNTKEHYQQKFKVYNLSYRILKSEVYIVKVSLTNGFNFIQVSCCDKYH